MGSDLQDAIKQLLALIDQGVFLVVFDCCFVWFWWVFGLKLWSLGCFLLVAVEEPLRSSFQVGMSFRFWFGCNVVVVLIDLLVFWFLELFALLELAWKWWSENASVWIYFCSPDLYFLIFNLYQCMHLWTLIEQDLLWQKERTFEIWAVLILSFGHGIVFTM